MPIKVLVVLLVLVISPSTASSEDVIILQSEHPVSYGNIGIHLREEGGYETGYIPDWFVGSTVGVSFFNWIRVDVAFDMDGFPGQDPFRIGALQLAVRSRVLGSSSFNALDAYAKGFVFLGNPISLDYPGSLKVVSAVVSPRAEGGGDFTAGLTGVISSGSPRLGLVADVNYSRTEARNDFPTYVTEGAKNRIFLNLVPCIFFNPGPFVGIQNRFTWWFDRGYMYDILPQVSWNLVPDLTLSAGVGFPIIGGGIWKFYAGIAYELHVATTRPPAPKPPAKPPEPPAKPVESPSAPAQAQPSPPDSPKISFIREGDNIRIRVYFSFLGDKADLFEPVNKDFGPQNKILVADIVDFLKSYPTYAIIVEGYTNRAKLNLSFDEEQNKEMLPLAKARANAVMIALANSGINQSRMKAAAYGGLNPLAPFTDTQNNWKNRRVEILLVKPPGKTATQ